MDLLRLLSLAPTFGTIDLFKALVRLLVTACFNGVLPVGAVATVPVGTFFVGSAFAARVLEGAASLEVEPSRLRRLSTVG